MMGRCLFTQVTLATGFGSSRATRLSPTHLATVQFSRVQVSFTCSRERARPHLDRLTGPIPCPSHPSWPTAPGGHKSLPGEGGPHASLAPRPCVPPPAGATGGGSLSWALGAGPWLCLQSTQTLCTQQGRVRAGGAHLPRRDGIVTARRRGGQGQRDGGCWWWGGGAGALEAVEVTVLVAHGIELAASSVCPIVDYFPCEEQHRRKISHSQRLTSQSPGGATAEATQKGAAVPGRDRGGQRLSVASGDQVWPGEPSETSGDQAWLAGRKQLAPRTGRPRLA